MDSAYIIAGCRTPQGRFLGGLSSLRSTELAGHVIRETVGRAKLEPASIDQVIVGQVISAGAGQAPARQASTYGGLPSSVGAVTVSKVCGSGLYSVMMADMAVRAGVYHRVLAGGMESMSQAPHLLRSGRAGWKYGEQPLLDAIDIDGLRCVQEGVAMGCIAEWVAMDAEISRQEQDQWAVRSHQRAVAAQDGREFDAEIAPISVLESKKTVLCSADEGPRRDCNAERLANLSPVFVSPLVAPPGAEKYRGTVTAGNSSTLGDGAAAVIVVDKAMYSSHPTEWAFRIVDHCSHASEHRKIFTAPVGAVQKLLYRSKMSLAEIDLFEINEAFAVQTLACIRELGVDADCVNVCGGAIALGHPLGCSGTRVLVTLLHQLVSRGLRRGIAALCLGGGEAVAMLVERV